MKHSIREHIVDPIRGKLVKVSTINAELGSGILDKNGREIFEGDIVKYPDIRTSEDKFIESEVHFIAGGLAVCDQRGNLSSVNFGNIEVVGHVDD